MHYDIDLLRKLDRVHPYPAKFPIDLAINYIDKYTEEELNAFIQNMHSLDKYEVDEKDILKDIFLGIYSNPLKNK